MARQHQLPPQGQGVSVRGVSPLPPEAGKFLIFDTRILPFGELRYTFRGKVRAGNESKKKIQFYGPEQPKVCILGGFFVKILLESSKISRFLVTI